jgi:hypothetical protein
MQAIAKQRRVEVTHMAKAHVKVLSIAALAPLAVAGCALFSGNTSAVAPSDVRTVELGSSASQGPKLVDFKGALVDVKPNKPFGASPSFEGLMKPNHKPQEQLNQETAAFYDQWKVAYLRNYPGSSVTYIQAEATGDEPEAWPDGVKVATQSEATGYGMMIFALMAGHDPHAKAYFDGLLGLYQANQSELGSQCMSWVIPNKLDEKLQKSSGATDGDFDIAYSLLLADKQWGSGGQNPDYLGVAKSMIESCILKFNISAKTNRILMGDWGKGQNGGVGKEEASRYNETVTRPSDWLLGHLKAFKAVDKSKRWDAAIEETYRLVGAVQNPKTGLFPDFAEDVGGKPQKAVLDLPYTDEHGKKKLKFLESEHDDAYGWNACRVPWRLAVDYAHYRDPRTKKALQTLNAWSTKLSDAPASWPGAIWHGYTLEGEKLNPGDDWSSSLAFTTPMVAALLASDNPQHQAYLNAGWDFTSQGFLGDHTESEGFSGYFADSIALLNMVLMSGNWWNPAS